MAKLTDKQKRFVDEYLIDLNGKQAAIRAGYKEKTAEQQASRLLSNVKVQAAIKKRMEEREKRTKITQDRVLQELAKIGFADIKDFLRFGTEKTLVGYDEEDGEMVPVYDYKQVVEVKPSEQVDGTLISEVSISAKGVFSFKMHDKMKALDMMGKHLGMFKDRIEHSGEGGGAINVIMQVPTIQDEDEWDKT